MSYLRDHRQVGGEVGVGAAGGTLVLGAGAGTVTPGGIADGTPSAGGTAAGGI